MGRSEALQRFTPMAVRVAQHAKERARRADASQIGTEHLLLGLLQEPEGVAAQALTRLGVVFRVVRDEIARLPVTVGEGRIWSAEARQALECALDEAVELNAAMGRPGIVDTEHVLLALTRDPSCTAMRILRTVAVEPTRLRQEVLRLVREANGGRPLLQAETLVLEPPQQVAAPDLSSPLPARAALATPSGPPPEPAPEPPLPAREALAAASEPEPGPPEPARETVTVASKPDSPPAPEPAPAAPAPRPVAWAGPALIDVNTCFGYQPRTGIMTTREGIRSAGERWGVRAAYSYHVDALLYGARAGNLETLDACEEDGFFRPVAVLSPVAYRPLEMVEWAKEQGFAFVRVFPDQHGFAVDGQACRDLLTACGAARLPVMVSALAAGVANLPRALDGIRATVILTENRYAVLGEVLALAGRVADLFLEVSGVNTPDGIALLAEAFGVDRLLWGSAYPMLQVGCGAMLLQYSGLTPEQIALIAHGNAARLLGG